MLVKQSNGNFKNAKIIQTNAAKWRWSSRWCAKQTNYKIQPKYSLKPMIYTESKDIMNMNQADKYC